MIRSILLVIFLGLLLIIGCQGGSSISNDMFSEEPIVPDNTTGPEANPEVTGECPNSSVGNPPCDTLAFGDGVGQDLWKPRSERNGNPVYLLNGEWAASTVVQAERNDGSMESASRDAECDNPDRFGKRQQFRFSLTCDNYSGRIVVTDQAKSCEIRLPDNACNRID